MPQQVTNVGSRVDFLMRQGADFSTTLTFTGPNAAPVDLTGCAFLAQIRRTGRDRTVVQAFTVAVVDPPTNGIAKLSISAALTGAIGCGETPDDPDWQYVWDLQFTDAASNLSSPLYGAVQILREVTRA